MTAIALSLGVIPELLAQKTPDGPFIFKVTNLEEAMNSKKYKCLLTDNSSTIRCILATQYTELVNSGKVINGSILKIHGYSVNQIGEHKIMLATALDVLETGSGASPMDVDAAVSGHLLTKLQSPVVTVKEEVVGPVARLQKENMTPQLSPGPAPSPSEEIKFKFTTPNTPYPSPAASNMRSSLTSPGVTPPVASAERRQYHKIGGLNPYDTNWCIKAKLSRKYPLRSISRGAQEPTKLFSLELVDDSGQQIAATFWRAQADRYAESLVEGRVYTFHRFKVKPSDKKFSTVKCDYQIDFMDSTEVCEARDQDITAMTAALDIVPIEGLLRHITRKAPIDVMGVVTQLGALGTVKRKSDNTELSRRDITLVDRSLKSVVITLWGDNAATTAAQLEGQEGKAVLQVTSVRVTDFNGCSLSTLTKSVISVNPAGEASEQLRSWYLSEGFSQVFTPVGEMAGARPSGGASRADKLSFVKDLAAISPEQGASDDKSAYNNVTATVALLTSEQNMFYLANPENGRKVVDQGGQYYSEHDQKVIERAEHRYVLSMKVADSTGEAYVNLFNKEAELVLGIKADDLAALKANDPDRFGATIKEAQWRQWSFTVASRGREYNGERKIRHTVASVKAMDWVAEGMKLMSLIKGY